MFACVWHKGRSLCLFGHVYNERVWRKDKFGGMLPCGDGWLLCGDDTGLYGAHVMRGARSHRETCVCAVSFSFATYKSHHRACHDDVTHELAEERPEEHAPRIGAEYAQGNGYGGAKDGQEGEQGYP